MGIRRAGALVAVARLSSVAPPRMRSPSNARPVQDVVDTVEA